ncbi:MAG: hypothetical protein A3F43_01040 [Gammaproteobacteria bacterium RIFCSPHIGHO2_12_FULL_42_10]|nr:MAG: hypothetical protein A3F43_01040 [Gammaproteobacteria bacterium RIFCSPHIGHO2_12_FULL_42_10]
MIRRTLIVQNALGIHTRAAAKLVDTAKQFESDISLTYRKRTINCKSIMGVITLGAQKDDSFDLEITGNDKEDALQAIEQLINNKFGEEA